MSAKIFVLNAPSSMEMAMSINEQMKAGYYSKYSHDFSLAKEMNTVINSALDDLEKPDNAQSCRLHVDALVQTWARLDALICSLPRSFNPLPSSRPGLEPDAAPVVSGSFCRDL